MSNNDFKGKFRDNLITKGEHARKVRKIVSIIILALILVISIIAFSGYLFIKSALSPVNPDSDEQVKIEIPLGSSTSTIAQILEDNGVINNALIYQFYVKFANKPNLQAGSYSLSPSMTLDEITDRLVAGENALFTITIPEGYNVTQIAEKFASELHFSSKEFLEVANNREYIKKLMDKYSVLQEEILDGEIKTPLEGYLYASTYSFYEKEPTIESIIEEMVSQTEKVITPYMEQIEKSDFSLHEIITFASLVEKEANKEEQRKEIAGVFYNRLEKDMRLQTDPTVAYAMGEHLEITLYKDLEVDSPYNTYQIHGLPIGPIANFSESSLDAVLNPKDTNYLYFLHDKEGNIHYAETNDEHNKNRQKYLSSTNDEM